MAYAEGAQRREEDPVRWSEISPMLFLGLRYRYWLVILVIVIILIVAAFMMRRNAV